MAPPNDNDNGRIRAQARRTQPVVVIDQLRRTTLPYGGVMPPGNPPPPSLPHNWQEQRTVSMRAPSLPPGARPARAMPAVASPPRPAPPPPRAPALPPPPPSPRAPAAPCRPSRPTPRVIAAPDNRMRQVHQRSEVIDALRAEISRLRRDK
jgi:hypothetical protein